MRDERGWSRLELADRAGVSAVYIFQLETGRRENPSLAVLKKLAKAFRVPVATLME